MDWNDQYEQVMIIGGFEPYGCDVGGCNHIANSMGGLMAHRQFGEHHMNHAEGRSMLDPQNDEPKRSWFKRFLGK